VRSVRRIPPAQARRRQLKCDCRDLGGHVPPAERVYRASYCPFHWRFWGQLLGGVPSVSKTGSMHQWEVRWGGGGGGEKARCCSRSLATLNPPPRSPPSVTTALHQRQAPDEDSWVRWGQSEQNPEEGGRHAERQSVAGSNEQNGLVSIPRRMRSRHQISTATQVAPLTQVQ